MNSAFLDLKVKLAGRLRELSVAERGAAFVALNGFEWPAAFEGWKPMEWNGLSDCGRRAQPVALALWEVIQEGTTPEQREGAWRAMLLVERLVNQRDAWLMRRCEVTWNACYSDRRPWSEIGEEAQQEWVRVFGFFEGLQA